MGLRPGVGVVQEGFDLVHLLGGEAVHGLHRRQDVPQVQSRCSVRPTPRTRPPPRRKCVVKEDEAMAAFRPALRSAWTKFTLLRPSVVRFLHQKDARTALKVPLDLRIAAEALRLLADIAWATSSGRRSRPRRECRPFPRPRRCSTARSRSRDRWWKCRNPRGSGATRGKEMRRRQST